MVDLIKEGELEGEEMLILILEDKKNKLVFDPDGEYSKRVDEMDAILATGLGEDMRRNVTQAKAKLVKGGKSKYVSDILKHVNQRLVDHKTKRDELIAE